MKKLALLLMLMWAISLIAEDKIGYFDSDRVFKESKLTQEAQKLFDNERQNWETQINELEQDIQRLTTEYETRKLSLSTSGKLEAESRIETMKQQKKNLINEIFGENGRADQRNTELLEPIRARMISAIEKVAVDNNLVLLFDISAGGVAYGLPKFDYTDQIMTEMERTDATDTQQGSGSGSGSGSGTPTTPTPPVTNPDSGSSPK